MTPASNMKAESVCVELRRVFHQCRSVQWKPFTRLYPACRAAPHQVCLHLLGTHPFDAARRGIAMFFHQPTPRPNPSKAQPRLLPPARRDSHDGTQPFDDSTGAFRKAAFPRRSTWADELRLGRAQRCKHGSMTLMAIGRLHRNTDSLFAADLRGKIGRGQRPGQPRVQRAHIGRGLYDLSDSQIVQQVPPTAESFDVADRDGSRDRSCRPAPHRTRGPDAAR